MPYRSALTDYQFLLDHVVGFSDVAATEKFAEATPDMVSAILTEAGRLCDDVLGPLQGNGDHQGAVLENGVVRTSPGFAEGYAAIAEGGWVGISADPEHGGMGLPHSIASVVNDMMSGACLSLQLNPLMTQGQIEALEAHASDTLKSIYLPKLISGEWCGTMNLTEPQAGSDVGALRSKAVDNGDGTYAVTGQKIFISWGDNDFTGNVCHLVLARLPDGVPGTKGISLFLVPKFIPDADGNPGERNSLRVVSLEEKMGLHGSPTAVMEFDSATGWMVGAPHAGMAAMFTMMNNARLGVGLQGIGVAEGAFQKALEFAADRKQGKTALGGDTAIADHPDVRRMLVQMKAEIFAARSIALACAVAGDMAHATGDSSYKARTALLTPMAKAFGTETGISVANAAIQVHGGMGFIEETGIAQYFRDVRVTAIYEGTNGIQSIDLVGRKLMDGGAEAFRLMDEMAKAAEDGGTLGAKLTEAVAGLRDATEWMLARDDFTDRLWGSFDYLMAFSRVLGGYYHLLAANAEGEGPRTKLANYYMDRILPLHAANLTAAMAGDPGLSVEELSS